MSVFLRFVSPGQFATDLTSLRILIFPLTFAQIAWIGAIRRAMLRSWIAQARMNSKEALYAANWEEDLESNDDDADGI